jgi:hypothetical protein
LAVARRRGRNRRVVAGCRPRECRRPPQRAWNEGVAGWRPTRAPGVVAGAHADEMVASSAAHAADTVPSLRRRHRRNGGVANGLGLADRGTPPADEDAPNPAGPTFSAAGSGASARRGRALRHRAAGSP